MDDETSPAPDDATLDVLVETERRVAAEIAAVEATARMRVEQAADALRGLEQTEQADLERAREASRTAIAAETATRLRASTDPLEAELERLLAVDDETIRSLAEWVVTRIGEPGPRS